MANTSESGGEGEAKENRSEATENAGGRRGEDRKRQVFPCVGCGADLVFHIGQQSLRCPFCGFSKELDLSAEAKVEEQDLLTALREQTQLRKGKVDPDAKFSQIQCSSCGAKVAFQDDLTSTHCAYCGTPVQKDQVRDLEQGRIPVDGVLSFSVQRETAREKLRAWIKSRWFAPNNFLKDDLQGRLSGVYLPYWTFDSMTFTHYRGERGEHYWVTVGSGKTKRRTRRTKWYPASGSFQRLFDDILVVASQGLPEEMVQKLEPWPLNECKPFNSEVLAGFLARTYDVSLEDGLATGKQQMEKALEQEVRQRIGGDTQRVHSMDTRYDALTYKHLLMPVWMLGHRFNDKAYQMIVNACTGKVQGERPYSWVKITLAVLAALAIIVPIAIVVANK